MVSKNKICKYNHSLLMYLLHQLRESNILKISAQLIYARFTALHTSLVSFIEVENIHYIENQEIKPFHDNIKDSSEVNQIEEIKDGCYSEIENTPDGNKTLLKFMKISYSFYYFIMKS